MGWVTQSYVDGDRAVSWLRTPNGSVRRVEEPYHPDFYALPRGDLNPDGFSWLLREEPRIRSAEVVERYPDLGMRKKIRVVTHIQRYLFSRGFAPTMLVEYRNHRFTHIEDPEELAPPPLTIITLRAQPEKRGILAHPERVPIRRITIRDPAGGDEELTGSEECILEALQSAVRSHDPDIIVAPSRPFRNLHYVVQRAKTLGRIVDSRQVYEAVRLGVLVPEAKGYGNRFRTLEELFLRDRGGLIISPRVGLHENVCALDFESMYPNLVLRRNISYETCTEGTSFRKGLLPRVAEAALERRLRFKHLRACFPRGCPEYVYADQRQEALKMMLVVIYGYSGCTWNRFQHVPTFESINLHGREILIRAINISMREGFQVVYADTDCVFVKKPEASREDFEKLARQISVEVGFPIAIDNLYRFLVLLPSKSNPLVDVVKRYYGKLYDGGLHQRGVEIRRHDTPRLIKRFQEELMTILFNARSAGEVVGENYRRAVEFTLQTYNRVLSGEVAVDELVVEKTLHKPVDGYSRTYPHVAAGKQLETHGVASKEGQLVRYVYVNHRSSNPLTRIQALPLYDGRSYDREKYGELVLEAAETLLGVFGFHPPKKEKGLRSLLREPRGAGRAKKRNPT
ncbi:MAG: DNA polymerase domain-containing protein [Candidatus Freyarchaeota archaeon]